MKKVIIHIGTHKTGSTAIQAYLTKERNALKDNMIIYPKTGCPSIAKYGQHNIPWSFVTNSEYIPSLYGEKLQIPDSQELINKIIEEYTVEGVLILSSEEFSTLTECEIIKLRNAFENVGINLDFEVIIYLRRQDRYLESAYKTSVLSGSMNSNIKDFCDNQRLNLNYLEIVKAWKRSFNTVKVRSYEDKSVSNDVVNDFLNVAELGNVCVNSKRQIANPSLNAEVIEIIRSLRLRGESESNIENIKNKALSLGNKKSTFINTQLFEDIKNMYSGINDEIFELYGCDLRFKEDVDYSKSISSFEQSLLCVTSQLLAGDSGLFSK